MILVDDQKQEWTFGMTLADLLKDMPNTEFCAAVRLNGKLVSSPAFETTLIPDQAILYLLPLIAGG